MNQNNEQMNTNNEQMITDGGIDMRALELGSIVRTKDGDLGVVVGVDFDKDTVYLRRVTEEGWSVPTDSVVLEDCSYKSKYVHMIFADHGRGSIDCYMDELTVDEAGVASSGSEVFKEVIRVS